VRLLVFLDSLRRHGAQRFLVRLAEGLRARGHAVRVVALRGRADPELCRRLHAAGAEFRVLGLPRLLLGGLLGPLWAEARRHPDAVVLTLLPWADTLGRPAARLAGRPVATSIRARNLDKPAWQRALDRRTMPWASAVIFNSPEVVDWSQRHEGVSPAQTVVIPNGVEDLADPGGARRAERREALGLTDEDFLLGSVGRLYPQKDHATLLRALARLQAVHGADFKLLVLGDGPLRGALERQARELGVDDLVQWRGEQEDLRSWYPAFDLLVHTATFEGLPNAVLEAMSAGTPVVATDVDGCRDLIAPGETGELVPPGDPAALAAAIQTARRAPEAARACAARGQQRVRERFSLAAMTDAWEAVLGRLAAGRRGAG
jgi:glycosyltransferase involved in cell wall biosynthesis